MDFEKDYYAILGLENTATLDEIKKTYRVLAKQYHPDVNKAPNAIEIFNAITEAYEVLSDDRHRAEYDENSLHGGRKRSHEPSWGRAGSASAEWDGTKENASPAEARLERTLLLSLIVPGVYQIAGGERKYGVLLLACYITFWVLAIIYSVEIGVLAVLIWAVAILDSYNTFRKRAWESSESVT